MQGDFVADEIQIDAVMSALGAKVRAAREGRKVSLRAMARKLDVSPSHLSLIERGRLRPSVEILWRIVSEFDLSLDSLLLAEGEEGQSDAASAHSPVQRADARRKVKLAHGVSWQRLTPVLDADVDFVFVEYGVGAASSQNQAQYSHGGREYGYVLAGRLGIAIGEDEYVLEPGDSISFDGEKPHRQWAVGDEPVKAVWFVFHPERAGGGSEAAMARLLGLT